MPGKLAPGTPRLRIIATNDFHGALEAREDASGVSRGGAAYVATVIEKAKTECAPACETVLLDGGDLFQGSIASNLTYGRSVLEYYNRMGYAAAAVGNHEFDWGQDTLKARMRGATFAFLAANVRTQSGADVPWIRDDTVVTRGTLKVGIIGIANSRTESMSFPKNVEGLRFEDPAPVIDARAKALRAGGADVVIVVAHEGGFCDSTCSGVIFSTAAKVTEKVDAIVAGHTHVAVNTVVNGIPIVMARTRGQAVAIVDIPIVDGKPSGTGVGEVRSVVATEIAPDPAIDSLVRRATASVSSLVNRRVGRLEKALDREGSQYPLGNLIADAQRSIGKGDIGVTNNGGIRKGLPAGELTYGELFEVQPFGNRLYRVEMTGAQVRAYLEQIVGRDQLREHVSGITISYNPELPKGSRIVSLTLPAGRTLSEASTYSVVMNEFLAVGGGEGVTVPKDARMTSLDILDIDALVAYMQKSKERIEAPTEPRIVITQ
jgi:2',3'-cyclic-nucleotide 2'-phosphodiesterase (5'-nucleotidase family)